MTHATLAEAIEWAQARWLERPVPLRVHVRDMESTSPTRKPGCKCLGCTAAGPTEAALGSHAFSHPFGRILGAGPEDQEERTEQVVCYHVGHPIGVSLFECRDCHGTGYQTIRRWRYRHPMWRAFVKLTHARNDTRHAHPAQLVAGLASMGWDARRAAERMALPWDLAEPLFLMALRKLHGRYEEGPVGRVGWTQMSESNRKAIVAGEAA